MKGVQHTSIHPIIIDNKSFSELSLYLKKENFAQLFVLVDENTAIDCLPILKKALPSYSFTEIHCSSGEAFKTIESCNLIWDQLTQNHAQRNSLILNLGGGVIGDMGGFAASTYKRGIKFIQIPTTVLAAVDASVGGKLGVNFKDLKNQIGLFNNPEAVFINSAFFDTLDERHLKSGLAEMLKHALIADPNYWKQLLDFKMDAPDWDALISKSIEIKSKIVAEDPLEKNKRKLLNFGHTIGHAFESFSLENDLEPLLHGEAVAIGLICECYISFKEKGLNAEELRTIVNGVLKKFDLYHYTEEDIPQLIELMKHDKKNEHSTINFTLLNTIGDAKFNMELSEETISESLHYYLNLKTTHCD